MRLNRASFLTFVFVFVAGGFGQNASVNAQIVSQQARIYQGEQDFPYLFEPYQADYIYKGKVVGVPFKFLTTSTRIIELKDEWEETQKIRLEFMDYFPDQSSDREAFREVEITSNIDLKTGLLKTLSGTFANKPDTRLFVSFAEDRKIVVTETAGKRTERKVYENREKIYPCTFSNAFLSYLPLDANFSGTFSCVDLNTDGLGNRNKIRFSRRTLRVVGSETVTIDAGTFDTYKLADETEEIKYNADGTIKEKKKVSNGRFDENKFWRNIYSNLWVDKRTRKVIKAELNFKLGNLTVEMQRLYRVL